jgi:hypothetical protein
MMALSCLCVVFLLTSCGGGLVTSKNEFLGEIPSIQKYYSAKTDAMKQELKQCTDQDDAFKLDKKLDLLKEEWKTKLEESLKANPLTQPFPFEPLKDQPFTITKISYANVNDMGFGFILSVKADQDIKFNYQDFWICSVALDKDGKEIEGSKSISILNHPGENEVKAGTETEVHGAWKTSVVSKMENFAKIRFITKDEFDKK